MLPWQGDSVRDEAAAVQPRCLISPPAATGDPAAAPPPHLPRHSGNESGRLFCPTPRGESAGAILRFSNGRAEKQIQTKGALALPRAGGGGTSSGSGSGALPGPRRPRPRSGACADKTWLCRSLRKGPRVRPLPGSPGISSAGSAPPPAGGGRQCGTPGRAGRGGLWAR